MRIYKPTSTLGKTLVCSFIPVPSPGPGKIAWTAADVTSMATSIKTTLPIGVASILTADTWKGGELVQLSDSISRPSSDDIILNACWIKPFIQRFRDRVPSQFFLVDTFLHLDKLYLGKLLVPTLAGECKMSLAAHEAKKVKLLVGSLRSLWRSSILVQSSMVSGSKNIHQFLFMGKTPRKLHVKFHCFLNYNSFLRPLR